MAISYLVLAWTEPTLAPPDGNVAAPINAGSVGQSKAGGLILNTGGADDGLFVYGTSTFNGPISVGGSIGAAGQVLQSGGSSNAPSWGSGGSVIGGGLEIFGNGSDGDYIVTVNETLSEDKYYKNLTINNGVELKPNGYRIFVQDTLTFIETGKIIAYGGDGGDGANGGGNTSIALGGSGGTSGNAAGTLPAANAGGKGADGDSNGRARIPGGNGGSTIKGLNPVNTATPGLGGDGEGTSSAIPSGTSGTNSGMIKTPLTHVFDVFYLRDYMDDNARFQITPGPGGAGSGGHGGSATCGGSSYCTGGAGGGSGGSGGLVWVATNNIVTVDGTTFIDVHGGDAGDGGDAAQYAYCSYTQSAAGGGGGAGGNGGVAIIIYSSKTGTGTINKEAGTGGTFGIKQINTGSASRSGKDGTAGGNGTAGGEFWIQI